MPRTIKTVSSSPLVEDKHLFQGQASIIDPLQNLDLWVLWSSWSKFSISYFFWAKKISIGLNWSHCIPFVTEWVLAFSDKIQKSLSKSVFHLSDALCYLREQFALNTLERIFVLTENSFVCAALSLLFWALIEKAVESTI